MAYRDSDFFEKLFGKQLVEDAVAQQSLPGKTAEQAAQTLAGAPELVPPAPNYDDVFQKSFVEDLVKQQSLPGKSAEEAAEVLAPKQLPTLSGPRSMVPSGPSPMSQVAKQAAIELGDDTPKYLPAVVNRGLPSVIEEAGEAAVKGGGSRILGAAGKLAGPVGLVSGLYGDLASANDSSAPIPGRPGFMAKGQDILPAGPEDIATVPTSAEQFNTFREKALKEKGFTNPVTGIRELPVLGSNKFENQIIDAYTKKQENTQLAMNKADKDKTDHLANLKARYDEISAKYAKLGLPPPPMPSELEGLMGERAPATGSTNEIPPSDSIFGAVSQKYQDLQKEGRVGQTQEAGGTKASSGEGKEATATGKPAAEKQRSLQDILSSIYGKDLGDDALKSAQGDRDRQQLIANLSTAGSQIGAALSRGATTPDLTIQKQLLAQAGQGVEDITKRRAGIKDQMETAMKASDLQNAEKLRDPKSTVSEAYRNTALQLNPKLSAVPGFENMNAYGVKELMPMIDMSIRMDIIKEDRARRGEEKAKTDIDHRFSKLGTVLTSELAGSRTAFGKAATAFASTEKIQTMVGNRNPNDLDSREIAELARQLDNVLSNGQPTISGMKKLIPESARANIAKLEEWLTNTRAAGQMGSFVTQMLHTVEREKQLSHDQIQRAQGKILGGYSDLSTKDPERWGLILSLHGLPSDVLPTAGKASKGPNDQPQHKQVEQDGNIFELGDDGEYHFLRKK